jgi:hypothetical protein
MDSPRSLRSRSLNLPVPTRSPTRSSQDTLNTQVYAQYLGLDRVMLNYLDMDGILELYALNHETFETREALGVLAQRFNLSGPFSNFKGLLAKYDRKYATVRSYHRINKKLSYDDQLEVAQRILLRAALQGNIQAVINGFKLYPDLLHTWTLNKALRKASQGGHETIIDLLLDLGVTNENNQIIVGALIGGHIDLVTGAKYQALHKRLEAHTYIALGLRAVYYEQLGSLKYLFSLPEYLMSTPNALILRAGQTGNLQIIKYLISHGANDYVKLVTGAMRGEHFDIVMKYLDQVDDGNKILQFETKYFLVKVIQAKRVDTLELLLKHNLVTRQTPSSYILPPRRNLDITPYLDSSSSESD